MRLSTAIARFDTQLQADGKSDHTRRAYLRDLRQFKEWHSNQDILTINLSELARYLAECHEGRPAISLNRTKTALRMFFKFLTDAGYLETDPARLVKNGHCEQKVPVHLVSTEVQRLLRAIPTTDGLVCRRDLVMFSLLLGTGMRLGSLVKVQVRDVDLKGRYIRVKAKGGVERKVYFNLGLGRRLKAYIKASEINPDDPLFPSREGGRLSSRQVQLRFEHWLAVAGIDSKYSVHSLRHTFAMNLYRNTGDLRLVQTALGHKRITTTEIYARVDDRRLKRALEKL
jgi:site-specific recombinase XerD